MEAHVIKSKSRVEKIHSFGDHSEYTKTLHILYNFLIGSPTFE